MLIKQEFGRKYITSETSDINEYHLQPWENNPPLIIIETPDYNTENINSDLEIIAKIRQFIDTKIEFINVVCFVSNSNHARLTLINKYFINQCLALFGKDIAENILCMLTFCNNDEPVAIEALKVQDSPYFGLIS